MFALFCEDCGELFVVFLDDDDDPYIGCSCSVDDLDTFIDLLDEEAGDLEVVDAEEEEEPEDLDSDDDKTFY